MTKIGILNFMINTVFVFIMSCILPFDIESSVHITLLYAVVQIVTGRYRDNILLIWDEMKSILYSHICFFVISLLFLFQIHLREILLLSMVSIISAFFCACCSRYSHIWLRPIFKKNVLIIGIGHTAEQLNSVITHNRFSLMDVRGFINCNKSKLLPNSYQQQQVVFEKVYPLDEIDYLIEKEKISTVIIAIPQLLSDDIDILMSRFANKVDEIKVLPRVENMVTFDSRVDDFDGLLMISTAVGKISDFSLFFKRVMDIFGGLIGCITLVPLYFLVRYKNRKEGDYDPVFFKQRRIGRYGKEFTIYKFRTMIPNAEEKLDELMKNDPEIYKEYTKDKKLKNDPRITKAGAFLRKTSLDEFPQFINVLKGDMTLIGPRPYLPREIPDMGDYYNVIIQVKPGITGMWQTHGRSDVDFEGRLKLDNWYFRNYNLWLDVTILIRTIKTILAGNDESAR